MKNEEIEYRTLKLKYNTYLENLNKNICIDDNMKRIIVRDYRYTMIIAAAGTGKTEMLTLKIKYLIEIKKIMEKEILIFSYTKAAAREMKERLKKIGLSDIKVTTFHSFCYNNEKIIKDRKQIIKQFLKKDTSELEVSFFDEAYNYYLNGIRTKLFTDYKLKKFDNYYKKYKKENNLHDFEDLINNYSLKKRMYKYIIVDEYQDISLNRVIFLKKLVDFNSSKLIVVGDDYQTIFSFSGSNISLFLKFNKIFKKSSLEKLLKTYRSPEGIVKLATKFVCRNRRQIKKNVVSAHKISNPIIFIKTVDLDSEVNKIINSENSVGVLGRYNKELGLISANCEKKTIHSSKGLSFDNVILISGSRGFPSLSKNHYLSDKNRFNQYLEERRLMYVALTRTKNRVYVIAHKNRESEFYKELEKLSRKLKL